VSPLLETNPHLDGLIIERSESLPPLRQVKPEDTSIEAVTVEEVWEAVQQVLTKQSHR